MPDHSPLIDYKRLRRINPEAARRAVLDYLAAVDGNVSATARAFGITRLVVYDIARRAAAGDLRDCSRRPHRQPAKTPPAVEARVIAARNRTGFGPKSLSAYLAREGLLIPWPTVRNILRRNRDRIHTRRRRAASPRQALPELHLPYFERLRRC